MKATYFNTSTSGTTPASVIDPQVQADENRVIKKIIVGKPTAGATLTLFSSNNALSNNTTNVVFSYTYPGSFGAGTPASDQFDFSPNSLGQQSAGNDGLTLGGGGCMAISSAMQVTVLWDYAEL